MQSVCNRLAPSHISYLSDFTRIISEEIWAKNGAKWRHLQEINTLELCFRRYSKFRHLHQIDFERI